MSIRPRRTFAPALVITLAGAASLAGAEPKPPTQPHENPPKPKAKEPAKTTRHWSVYKLGNDCFASNAADACPPPAAGQRPVPCNPPFPTKYACPKEVSLPLNIVQYAGETECYLDRGPQTCPPNISCNPPPPKKLACPQ